MNVWKHGNDSITYNDDTNTYKFIIDGNVKVEISNTTVRVFNHLGDEVFSINEQGGLYIRQNKFEMDQIGENYLLSIGTGLRGDYARGRVEIRNQAENGQPGEEFYEPSKAGILVLYDKSRQSYFFG